MSFDVLPANLGRALSPPALRKGIRLSGSSRYVLDDVVKVPVGTCVDISLFGR